MVKKKGITYKLADPHQKTMMKVEKEKQKGIIKTEKEIKERFQEIYQIEMAKELTKIRNDTKETFYRAIIASGALGLLGGFLTNTMFIWIKNSSTPNTVMLLLGIIGFFGALGIIIYEFEMILSGKWNRSLLYILRHTWRRFKLKQKK